MRLNVLFQEEQSFNVGLQQNEALLGSNFGEVQTITERNYEKLLNKPKINNVELIGELSAEDLGLGRVLYDTTENWEVQPAFTTIAGAVYIYSDAFYIEDGAGNRTPIAGLKIGDGVSELADLPFVTDKVTATIINHITDSSVHMLPGGSTGQVLTKNSGVSYDVSWKAIPTEVLSVGVYMGSGSFYADRTFSQIRTAYTGRRTTIYAIYENYVYPLVYCTSSRVDFVRYVVSASSVVQHSIIITSNNYINITRTTLVKTTLSGGITGQVLTKNSNTDNDYSWKTPLPGYFTFNFIYYYNLTYQYGYWYANKTFDEVRAAYDSGQVILAVDTNANQICTLVQVTNNEFVFERISQDVTDRTRMYRYTLSSTNTVTERDIDKYAVPQMEVPGNTGNFLQKTSINGLSWTPINASIPYDSSVAYASGTVGGEINDIKTAITGGLVFEGETTTELTDGSTISEIEINSSTVTAFVGMLVVYNSKEFVWDGSKWIEMGDLSLIGDLGWKDSASGVYTPEGTVSQPSFTGSDSSVSFTVTDINGDEYTNGRFPIEGSVSQPTFTGSMLTSTGTFTPSGSISAPTISLKTAGSTTTVNSITAVGTLPELTTSVTNENLSISFSQGTLPTKGSDTTVKTGDAAYEATAPTFTGTQGNLSVSGTPAGTVSKPTFTGYNLSVAAITVPQGTISQPTFTGTEATITVT